MTVVAYKDGVMASDSGLFINDSHNGSIRKILKNKHGFLFGGAGSISQLCQFFELVENTDDLKTTEWDTLLQSDNISVIIVDPSGQIWLWEGEYPYQIDVSYIAEGAGFEMALGALAFGANAEQAVEVCIKHHTKCAGPIQRIELG